MHLELSLPSKDKQGREAHLLEIDRDGYLLDIDTKFEK